MLQKLMVSLLAMHWYCINLFVSLYPLSITCLLLGGFSVFAGVGERTREGNDLYKEMIESGVIKLDDKQVKILPFVILFKSADQCQD